MPIETRFPYSFKVLGEKTGLSPSYISKVMNGKRIPRLHNAWKIAKALEVTLDDLYKYLARSYYKYEE